MVEVAKKTGESNESVVRRFVRKIQASGKLLQAKKNQYRQPKQNKRRVRESAIRRAKASAEREYLRKIGKLEESVFSARGSKIKVKKK
ncbi:MAG: 30S ribosomal protein S21 [Patescibacteria group bacterium]